MSKLSNSKTYLHFHFVYVVISIGEDDDVRNDDLLPDKIISCIVGIYFVFIFLFWILVSSCTFARGCPSPPSNYNYYFLSVIWFLLLVFGTGLVFALLMHVVDNKESIEYYFTCERRDSTLENNPNSRYNHCVDYVVLWALIAIIMYLLYCISVFCLIVMKTIIRFLRHCTQPSSDFHFFANPIHVTLLHWLWHFHLYCEPQFDNYNDPQILQPKSNNLNKIITATRMQLAHFLGFYQNVQFEQHAAAY